MTIQKTKNSSTSIGVKRGTKDAFNDLVRDINESNWEVNGEDAAKITHDDVLLELIRAYRKVEMG